jgi:hypothetical protein
MSSEPVCRGIPHTQEDLYSPMMSQITHESLMGRGGGLLIAQDADTETHHSKTVFTALQMGK